MKAPSFAHYHAFRFRIHTKIVGGLLEDTPEHHACWYYARCATKMMKAVDEGAVYEGDSDPVNMLNNLARAVAMQYQLDSPEDFLRVMPVIRMEVMRIDGGWDERIAEPWRVAFKTGWN